MGVGSHAGGQSSIRFTHWCSNPIMHYQRFSIHFRNIALKPIRARYATSSKVVTLLEMVRYLHRIILHCFLLVKSWYILPGPLMITFLHSLRTHYIGHRAGDFAGHCNTKPITYNYAHYLCSEGGWQFTYHHQEHCSPPNERVSHPLNKMWDVCYSILSHHITVPHP